MKWFELLRQEYDCPVAMLQVPYQADGHIHEHYRGYIVDQLKSEVIPQLEKVSGRKFDLGRLQQMMQLSAQAEDDLVRVLESAKNVPSPIDAYFGGVYYIGPMFSAFRGTPQGVEYYRALREEVEERRAAGLGPVLPDGQLEKERYRLVIEGPPNWTSFREFWKMFYDEGAVVVASTYTKVGGLYDRGFRHDPARPLESLAEYCLGCYTNLGLPTRVALLEQYIRDYRADGFMINSVKSCNSFSVGQLLMLRQLEGRTGVPGGFIESDLVDPRYFSGANIKNRIESYLQMIEQKRASRVPA
jgi:benzoyl-CoA reductase subunit B